MVAMTTSMRVASITTANCTLRLDAVCAAARRPYTERRRHRSRHSCIEAAGTQASVGASPRNSTTIDVRDVMFEQQFRFRSAVNLVIRQVLSLKRANLHLSDWNNCTNWKWCARVEAVKYVAKRGL